MRADARNSKIRVRAIAGTHVVLIATNVRKSARGGLLGLAIGRKQGDGSVDWLKGTKVFPSVIPNPVPGDSFPSNLHPVQSLIWSDFIADPGAPHTYVIGCVYGPPANPVMNHRLEISVRTEDPYAGEHGIWFNMGAIASQGFSRNFHNKKPKNIDDPKDPEVKWLSRGLLEAALAYIAQAGPGDALHVAAYEFTYPPVLLAFKQAAARGAVVKIVHEAGKAKNKTTKKLEDTSATKSAGKAVKSLGLDNQANLTLIKRTNREKIPHNKFIILSRNGVPEQVWTGSTNMTESGFLGQTNVGHVVRNRDIAAHYKAYWDQLATDPLTSALADWSETTTPLAQISPRLNNGAPEAIVPLFSPRRTDDMLVWYADRIAAAQQTVMFTAPFGINKLFLAQFAQDKDYPRFVILEDPLSPDIVERLKADADVATAAGSLLGNFMTQAERALLPPNSLDRWFLKEDQFRHSGFVFFVHTKILMIDPLSDDPLIFSGSANFSTNSLEDNDENMLLIRGNTAVADVYVTEFDRIFRHFFARQETNRSLIAGGDGHVAKFLQEDASWLDSFIVAGAMKTKRQRLFFPLWPA